MSFSFERLLFVEVPRKLPQDILVDVIVHPKTLLVRLDDSAVHKKPHVIRQGGLTAVEMFEDFKRALIVLEQQVEYFHAVRITQCLADADILFSSINVLPSRILA